MTIQDPFLLGMITGIILITAALLSLGWRPADEEDESGKESFRPFHTMMTDDMIHDMLAGYSEMEKVEKLQEIFGKDYPNHLKG